MHHLVFIRLTVKHNIYLQSLVMDLENKNELIRSTLVEYKKCYEALIPKHHTNSLVTIDQTITPKLKAIDRFISALKDIDSLLSNEDRTICENFKKHPNIISLEPIGAVLRIINKTHH